MLDGLSPMGTNIPPQRDAEKTYWNTNKQPFSSSISVLPTSISRQKTHWGLVTARKSSAELWVGAWRLQRGTPGSGRVRTTARSVLRLSVEHAPSNLKTHKTYKQKNKPKPSAGPGSDPGQPPPFREAKPTLPQPEWGGGPGPGQGSQHPPGFWVAGISGEGGSRYGAAASKKRRASW